MSDPSPQVRQLLKMANQIALNLAAGGDEQLAAQRTAEHFARFWAPAMRRQLAEAVAGAARTEASPVVVAAIQNLESNSD